MMMTMMTVMIMMTMIDDHSNHLGEDDGDATRQPHLLSDMRGREAGGKRQSCKPGTLLIRVIHGPKLLRSSEICLLLVV